MKQKLYALLALVLVSAVVMFPLWPVKMRLGVWYLSMGMLGLLGLFFAMAIFRLILFCVTVFVVPPGLWLYPNLFEDVGFFDSFRPVWGWQEDKKKKAKRIKAEKKEGKKKKAAVASATPTATPPVPAAAGEGLRNRDLAPRVEEVDEE
jgi:translocation protein SEC62